MLSYEITVTVNPKTIIKYYDKPYGKLLASQQWEWLQYHINQILREHSQFVIYPEFHKNYNIHVHGHVLINQEINEFTYVDIKKKIEEFGRSRFRPIMNLDSWLSYIKKDYEELKSFYKTEYYDLYLDTHRSHI